MATKVENVNAALMMIGGLGDLTSLSQNRREAQVANRIYDTTKLALMTEYMWRFAITRKKLNKLTVNGLYGLRYAYQLPTDCLRVLQMEPVADYDIENDTLITDVSGDVYIKYLREMPEGEWPAWFTQTFILRLASMFATAIAEDNTKFQLLDDQYNKQRQIAMAIDGSQRPPLRLDSGLLLRGRRSGRSM